MHLNLGSKNIKNKFKEFKYELWRSFRQTKIYDLHLKRKYAKQRAKRGWADEDLFSIDWWLQSKFVEMLDNFQQRTHGHPQEEFEEVNEFPKEWIDEQLVIIKQEMLNSTYTEFTEEDIDEFITNMDDYIKWKLIIKRIIFYLKESNEDSCSMKNEPFEQWHNNNIEFAGKEQTQEQKEEQKRLIKSWTERQLEINLYMQECVNKAFSLISKYFYNLWD